MSTFIISDTHFSHRLVTPLRGFSSIEEHDNALISNWNSVITDHDKVYHLGDVVFQSATRLNVVLPQLKGEKILVMGNHDYSAKYYLSYFSKICAYFEIGRKYILSHYPIHPTQMNKRYLGYVNLHGHIHRDYASKELCDLGSQYLNVNCEFFNLSPIPLSTIDLIVSNLPKKEE